MPIYIRDSQAELIMVRYKDEIEFVQKEQASFESIKLLENQGDSEYSAWNETSIMEMLDNTDYGVILARYKGKDLGYIAYKKIIDEWEIERVVVNKGARNQGVARLMLVRLIEMAKQVNISKIILEVNEMNYPAYRLYSSMGFVEDGKRKDYYGKGKNAILMSMKI
jgi:ribosomal-protein-alanine N-acetyltransferase